MGIDVARQDHPSAFRLQGGTKLNLIVVGLDGMTFDVINPLIEMGHLPNIARLMGEGAHSTLLSTVPSITPVAWSSFITGKSPGGHGVYDWGIKTADHRMSIINANYFRGQCIWTLLHRAGKQIGVIGLPMSYPPSSYPSFMIGGPLSPGVHSRFTFPETLHREIKENVGEYIIDFEKRQQLAKGEEAFVAAMARLVRARGETTLYLMQKYPWDVLMPVFIATDRLQHYLWQHLSFSKPLTPIQQQIIEFYNLVDEYIGHFIEVAPDPKTVILLSDHGFGPGRRKVSLNGWLMQEGYLRPGQSDPAGIARQRVVAFANRIGLARSQFEKWLSRLGLLDRLGNKIDRISTYEVAFEWPRSAAFAGGPGIYLNVKGRERDGIVAPGDEYQRVRKEISEKLSQLRDPQNGEAVFEKVCYREAFYSGRRVDMAPDIVLVANDGYKIVTQFYKSYSVRDDVFDDPHEWDRGMHRREGILIAWGEAIEASAHLQKPPHIWDMAPTLLHLADVPIPADMTGQMIAELVKPEYREHRQFVYEETREADREREDALWASAEGEQLVEERLRGLGYLE